MTKLTYEALIDMAKTIGKTTRPYFIIVSEQDGAAWEAKFGKLPLAI